MFIIILIILFYTIFFCIMLFCWFTSPVLCKNWFCCCRSIIELRKVYLYMKHIYSLILTLVKTSLLRSGPVFELVIRTAPLRPASALPRLPPLEALSGASRGARPLSSSRIWSGMFSRLPLRLNPWPRSVSWTISYFWFLLGFHLWPVFWFWPWLSLRSARRPIFPFLDVWFSSRRSRWTFFRISLCLFILFSRTFTILILFLAPVLFMRLTFFRSVNKIGNNTSSNLFTIKFVLKT